MFQGHETSENDVANVIDASNNGLRFDFVSCEAQVMKIVQKKEEKKNKKTQGLKIVSPENVNPSRFNHVSYGNHIARLPMKLACSLKKL